MTADGLRGKCTAGWGQVAVEVQQRHQQSAAQVVRTAAYQHRLDTDKRRGRTKGDGRDVRGVDNGGGERDSAGSEWPTSPTLCSAPDGRQGSSFGPSGTRPLRCRARAALAP